MKKIMRILGVWRIASMVEEGVLGTWKFDMYHMIRLGVKEDSPPVV